MRAALIVMVVCLALGVVIAIVSARVSDWRGPRPLPAGDVEQITSSGATETSPTLSPDGQSLAYQSDEAGTGDIFIRRIGDEHAVNLTNSLQSDETDPSFSPDGEWIAFRTTGQMSGIFVMKRDGSSRRRLTQFGVTPTWSPDSRTIFFATRSGIAATWSRGGTSEGWKVDVATATAARITRNDFRYPQSLQTGRASPIGDMRGHLRRDAPGPRADIWTMKPDGSAPGVTDDDPMDWNPIWWSNSPTSTLSQKPGQFAGYLARGDRRAIRPTAGPATIGVRTAERRWFAHALCRRSGARLVHVSLSRSIYRMAFNADARSVEGAATVVVRAASPFTAVDPSPRWFHGRPRFGPPSEHIYLARSDGAGLRQGH